MNAFCLMFADSFRNVRIGELTEHRSLAAMPFYGRYRMVDFLLSSLSHAHVRNIGIISKGNYNSLMDHIGSGKDWDLNHKRGGISYLTPYSFGEEMQYNNQFEALFHARAYINSMKEEYCIVADSNIICNIDFDRIIEEHRKSEADISFLYYEGIPKDGEITVSLNQDNMVRDVMYQDGTANQKEKKNCVLNIYVINREFLNFMVNKGKIMGWRHIDVDFLVANMGLAKCHGVKMDSYVKVIRNLEDYYSVNMEFLQEKVRTELLESWETVLTKIKDSCPTKYGFNSVVKNSIIADGCYIDGTVENSIVFRNVTIEPGSVIKDSIVMQSTIIRNNVKLNHVITDKNVIIRAYNELSGSTNNPYAINKGVII